jgi:Putative glucoamylase
MVANAVPSLHDAAWSIATSMNFGFYYDPSANPDAATGLIRGGYWPEVPIGDVATPTNGPTQCIQRRPGPPPDPPFAGWTCHHYGAFNTEPRIASYVGIALGQIPADHYFGGWRTFPNTCDWSWQEARPDGAWRDYTVNRKTVHVFEGAYRYRDMKLVPTWGGSMFEALMVPLVVPEEDWGPKSWGVTHPLYVQAQIQYGLAESRYGYWGFSPSSDPAGGYREYGVDAIGMLGDGYTTDEARRTQYDAGWADPNCQRPARAISDYDGGVVTPHAAFLALDFDATAALANLAALKGAFPAVYGKGGFKDAVNVTSGQVADRYLALDQGMVMAAVANELTGNRLQGYLASTLQPVLQPLMAKEKFNAGIVRP